MSEMKQNSKKPAIYGVATSADGPRHIISESRREEYDASVERLREAARAFRSDRVELLADYLYAEYAGRGLDARRNSIYAERWVKFAQRALEYAGIVP